MSAVNPSQASSSPRPLDRAIGRPAEPSMEEILASIRRIIADDQAAADLEAPIEPAPSPRIPPLGRLRANGADRDARDAAGEAAPDRDAPLHPEPPHAPPPGDRLPPAEQSGHASELPDLRAAAAEEARASHASPREAEPGSGRATRGDDVARDRNDGDRGGADGPRAPALISQATDASLTAAFNMRAATRLIDDSAELRLMTRELIQPLLKDWLDEHLPSLVERLVRAEIERVARGGR